MCRRQSPGLFAFSTTRELSISLLPGVRTHARAQHFERRNPIRPHPMPAADAKGCVRHIIVIVAMEQEVTPLVQRFDLKPAGRRCFLPGAPFVAWVGKVDNGRILMHAVWCGRDTRFGNVNNVASQAAAVATYAALAAFGSPDLLISAGTAGGFAAAGAAVGDVFLSSKCVFHSRRIPGEEGLLEEYGFGHYRSPPLGGLAANAGLKLGVVSTSDSLDAAEMDLALMRSEGAAVKEMEAAAVAWVCQVLSVPFVAVKAITDIVDGQHATRHEFESNLASASHALQEKMALLVALVSKKPLQQWALPSGATSAQPNQVATTPSPLKTALGSSSSSERRMQPPSSGTGARVGSALVGGVGALAVGLLLGVVASQTTKGGEFKEVANQLSRGVERAVSALRARIS